MIRKFLFLFPRLRLIFVNYYYNVCLDCADDASARVIKLEQMGAEDTLQHACANFALACAEFRCAFFEALLGR